MEPLTAALCAIGAMALLGGSNALTSLALFAGFYGVHRALRTGASRALIAAPALIWLLAQLWTLLPDAAVDPLLRKVPSAQNAPAALAALALTLALIAVVVIGRRRIGGALTVVALTALGIVLLLRLVPSSWLQHETSNAKTFWELFKATEVGWSSVARSFAAICMFLIGLGPVDLQPLPRRGGAIAGALGGTLLAAGIAGMPEGSDALLYVAPIFVLAPILIAVGVGAMARAGAGLAGWIGVGAVVLAVLGVLPALLILHGTSGRSHAYVMAMPFALLGIGVALLGWKGAPLEIGRRALGIAFIAAFAGGTLAWMSTFLWLAKVTRTDRPWALANITTAPIATYGLVLWAALLLYLSGRREKS